MHSGSRYNFHFIVKSFAKKDVKNLYILPYNMEQEQIFNSHYSKDNAILKLKFDKNKKYHIHKFENELYIPLSNTTLNKISLSFSDKYDRYLNLNSGE
jgi:hypothetical protein